MAFLVGWRSLSMSGAQVLISPTSMIVRVEFMKVMLRGAVGCLSTPTRSDEWKMNLLPR
jgi:hypothetical protein